LHVLCGAVERTGALFIAERGEDLAALTIWKQVKDHDRKKNPEFQQKVFRYAYFYMAEESARGLKAHENTKMRRRKQHSAAPQGHATCIYEATHKKR